MLLMLLSAIAVDNYKMDNPCISFARALVVVLDIDKQYLRT
jgi:hypothetical protein